MPRSFRSGENVGIINSPHAILEKIYKKVRQRQAMRFSVLCNIRRNGESLRLKVYPIPFNLSRLASAQAREKDQEQIIAHGFVVFALCVISQRTDRPEPCG